MEASGFSAAPASGWPSGIWSNGETAWVADLDDTRLYAYCRSDGERQPATDIAYLRRFPRTIVGGDELMVVSGTSEWARRASGLRVQVGWTSHSGLKSF